MVLATVIDQAIIFRDTAFYASHPHATLTRDGNVLVVFNRAPRHPVILHPPHDPEYRNVITRSSDQGKTWSAPQVAPNYDASGTECAGLTVLPSGRVLMSQWQNRWYPLDIARASPREAMTFPSSFVTELIESAELDTGQRIASSPEAFAPWARGHGTAFVHISDSDGHYFDRSASINTGPYEGGYGLRECVILPSGSLLLPLNDIPAFQTIFSVRSDDHGLSWHSPQLIARMQGRLFTEPALVQTAAGDLVCMIRDDTTRIMHSCRSNDEGATWSAAEPTGIDGYPPHLLKLPDGRLLCTYGVRVPEFSVRAVVSVDDGRSWDTQNPIFIRRHLRNRDLGYPATVQLPDASLLTVYYCEDGDGITGVEHTHWRI